VVHSSYYFPSLVITSQPSSLTITVCSDWATIFPSDSIDSKYSLAPFISLIPLSWIHLGVKGSGPNLFLISPAMSPLHLSFIAKRKDFPLVIFPLPYVAKGSIAKNHVLFHCMAKKAFIIRDGDASMSLYRSRLCPVKSFIGLNPCSLIVSSIILPIWLVSTLSFTYPVAFSRLFHMCLSKDHGH